MNHDPILRAKFGFVLRGMHSLIALIPFVRYSHSFAIASNKANTIIVRITVENGCGLFRLKIYSVADRRQQQPRDKMEKYFSQIVLPPPPMALTLCSSGGDVSFPSLSQNRKLNSL